MTTTSPSPFSESGQRQLSIKEAMQRAKALACTASKDKKPSCASQLFVGMFFDGTGNNREEDYVKSPVDQRKHSNIVRLFHAHRYDPETGYFRIYIPGVGTPFPEIGDDNKYWGPNRGAAAGEKGQERIIWALLQLLNVPHQYVTKALLILDGLAKTITNTLASVGSPAAQRRMALRTWQEKLAAALKGRKPQVEQINLSVFGFSRGAAEARVFVNWLFEVCEQEGGGWTFAGIPLRVQFLGIFDTVASVGLANLFDNGILAGHQGWADNTLEIHPAVEQCVHFVAGHEVRACFPLDSVRVKSAYPANALEVMYPGSHSDVGGGYAPNALGVSPAQDSFMSIIPGVNMYHEARKAGVPLMEWSNLKEAFQRDFTPSQATIRDFNAYLKAAKAGSGSVEEVGRKHMAHYFSYRFKHRGQFYQRVPYTAALTKDQKYLKKTQECLIERLGSLLLADDSFMPFPGQERKMVQTAYPDQKQYSPVPGHVKREKVLSPEFDPAKSAHEYEKRLKAFGWKPDIAQKHVLEVAKRIDVHAVTSEIEGFFDRYIHDSMAGFMDMKMDEYDRNGIGIAKFRTVFKGND